MAVRPRFGGFAFVAGACCAAALCVAQLGAQDTLAHPVPLRPALDSAARATSLVPQDWRDSRRWPFRAIDTADVRCRIAGQVAFGVGSNIVGGIAVLGVALVDKARHGDLPDFATFMKQGLIAGVPTGLIAGFWNEHRVRERCKRRAATSS